MEAEDMEAEEMVAEEMEAEEMVAEEMVAEEMQARSLERGHSHSCSYRRMKLHTLTQTLLKPVCTSSLRPHTLVA